MQEKATQILTNLGKIRKTVEDILEGKITTTKIKEKTIRTILQVAKKAIIKVLETRSKIVTQNIKQ